MTIKKVIVEIPSGLHLRPAEILSQTAGLFDAVSEIEYGYHVVNVSSILNIVASGIRFGAEVCVRCEGPEEKEAAEAIAHVLTDPTIDI